jgi:hypothetical protein
MQRNKVVFMFLAVMLTGVIAQAQSKEWLHVLVNDTGKEETVRINVPIALMETLLPMIQEKAVQNGKIRIDDKSISKAELKKLWAAVKQEGDTEYVTVEKPGERVTISMQGKFFVVQTDENSSKSVDIKIPAAVMDAMLAGDGNEFNLMAAAKALRESGIKDIVSVKDHDSTVRVWIDNNKQAL